MNLVDIAKSRYATKQFDGSKRIPEDLFLQIKALLRLSPSSVNSQPWHFVIADTPEGKQRLALGAQGHYRANEAKILNASHVVLFCAKIDMDDAYIETVTDREDQDGRFPNAQAKAQAIQVRRFYADLHRKERQDTQSWMEKQVYLNMGTLLLGAGVLGLDAVPIEGVDLQLLNEELALHEQGYTAVALVALGYRAEDDFNAALPKSRLPEEALFTYL